MTGWELDCAALDALGEAANTDVPPHRCRVRACPTLLLHRGELCQDHDTAKIRAMVRPHLYVFNGDHVVLESRPLDDWDTASSPAPAVPPAPLRTTPMGTSRPCWAWCGRPGPSPHCHPASSYGHAPTFPCLACGREIHACEGDVLYCRDQCAEFMRDLETIGPAQTSAAWFADAEREAWEERAAILQDSVLQRGVAERRALLLVWRALRAPGADQRAAPPPRSPATATTPAAAPAPTPSQRQLKLF
jgi:hypothetical protein